LRKIVFFFITIIGLLFITACNEIAVPAGDVNNKIDIAAIVGTSAEINELYYEERPQSSFYSGGVKIENTSKVWLKENILKTADEISFYIDDELLYTETLGQLYDYNTLGYKRYYIGPYPEQAHLHTSAFNFQDSIGLPRDQTILWYSDKATHNFNMLQEDIYQGEECLIVEILKNNSGSTQVWISKDSGLPVKIVNNYNGNTSTREYHSFKIGEGAVPDTALVIPSNAIIIN